MKHSTKIWLGIGTAGPIIGLGLFFLLFFSTIFGMIGSVAPHQAAPPPWFFVILGIAFLFYMLTIFLVYAMLIIYIILICRNDQLQGDIKAVWIIVILFGGMIGMGVYWFLHVWPLPEPAIETAPA